MPPHFHCRFAGGRRKRYPRTTWHSFVPPLPYTCRQWPIDQTPASLGLWSRLPACGWWWYGNRTRDSQIHCLVLLPSELTTRETPLRTHSRNTPDQPKLSGVERAAGKGKITRPSFQVSLDFLCKDAGGSRTHLNRVAAGRRAVWLQRLKTRPPRWAGDYLFVPKSSGLG